MTRTAFLIMKSPQEIEPTHTIKRFSDRHEASAILVEDGVYQATIPAAAERLGKAANEILVSKEDAEARGFSASDLKAGKMADYGELVDCIMERTDRTITV